jgi:hypothetical protein
MAVSIRWSSRAVALLSRACLTCSRVAYQAVLSIAAHLLPLWVLISQW